MEYLHHIPVTVTDGVGLIPETETEKDKENIVGVSIEFEYHTDATADELAGRTTLAVKHDGNANFVREGTPATLLHFSPAVSDSGRYHRFLLPYEARGKRIAGKITSSFASEFKCYLVLRYGKNPDVQV